MGDDKREHQEAFEGLLRPNLSPAQSQEAESVWMRFAMASLQGVTRQTDAAASDPGDVAELACDFADAMTYEWDARFHEKPYLVEPEPEPE